MSTDAGIRVLAIQPAQGPSRPTPNASISPARPAGCTFLGRVSTLAVTATIALREVRSPNPKAPKFEVLALNPATKSWVQVGALFELVSNSTGEAFLNGKLDDPSFAQPLYVSAFRQADGSYNIVWQRPQKRRDTAALAPKGDEGLPPVPTGASDDADTGADGLGESTAAYA